MGRDWAGAARFVARFISGKIRLQQRRPRQIARTRICRPICPLRCLHRIFDRHFVIGPLVFVLSIAILAALVFLAAYRFYGRWLARVIFRLDDDRETPSVEFRDDADYMPTPTTVLFGHHFTSIAGTGPIVGPAVAVVWGWGPALIWVVLGSVFIGAVHDFGSLVISLRSGGQTIGDVAGRVINPRVRLLFSLVLFLALTIVLAIFGLVIAAVFKTYPSAITPCLIQIPIAVGIGMFLRHREVSLLIPSLVALTAMYATVLFGNVGVLGEFNAWAASLPILVWVAALLVYSYVASVLPVWVLLQPRDYINSLQLSVAIGLVVLGLVVAGLFGGLAIGAPTGLGDAGVDQVARVPLTMAAPMIRSDVANAPLLFPFLFVTIACGACSGFHCLVSSGTSSKQLARESDALAIGYGSMLGEGFLAVVVILACVAGLGLGTAGADGQWLTGNDAYLSHYATWGGGAGLSVKISGFVDGSANFLHSIGIPGGAAVAIIGVLVASFAGTTMDTACRLQRYIIQELARSATSSAKPDGFIHRGSRWLSGKHGATILAVSLAMAIASLPGATTTSSFGEAFQQGETVSWFVQNGGKGGMILWPLFGATNQLLAGIALMVISFSLWRRGLPVWFVAIPTVFMLAVPIVAMGFLIKDTLASETPSMPVLAIGIATAALQIWMVVEAILLWPKVRGITEDSFRDANSDSAASLAK